MSQTNRVTSESPVATYPQTSDACETGAVHHARGFLDEGRGSAGHDTEPLSCRCRLVHEIMSQHLFRKLTCISLATATDVSDDSPPLPLIAVK